MALIHRRFPISVEVSRTRRWRPGKGAASPCLPSGFLIHCLTPAPCLRSRPGWSLSVVEICFVAVYSARTSAAATSAAGLVSRLSREARSEYAYDDLIATFIAIIINSLDETKRGKLFEGNEPVSRQDLVRELRATQETLKRLEERLNAD